MIPLGTRLVVLSLVLGAAIGGRLAWEWQADEYGRQLGEKELAHAREREAAAAAALDQLKIEQGQRRALEGRLQEQGKTHWKEMSDAQQNQARLRDRLATADLRLSVLLDASAAPATSCDGGGRASTGAGGVVAGAIRAQLDPAHARRIIAITDEGDRAVIALTACQSYVREITK